MTDLPIETSLDPDAYYQSPRTGKVERGALTNAAGNGLPWRRLGPVAEYRPAPVEPTGLGAVVKDAKGHVWVRIPKSIKPWRYSHNAGFEWKQIDQPVTVLSEGVTE